MNLRLTGGAALVALALGLGAPRAATAQQRIYLGNDDHTDYFWTGTDVTYRAAFLAMLDYYMNQAESTAGNAPDFRGRFTCDNSLWVWEYERNRSPADFARLVRHLRAGTITMSMQSLVPLYGAMPTEAVLRDLYYAGRLERAHGLDFDIVQAMENMTLPAGVVSLWAGAGARYSWRGVCGCATRTASGNRPREIYNAVGHDGRGVVMKWNTLYGDASLGGYAEARNPSGAIRYMTGDAGFRARWPFDVMGAFGYGHDDLQTTTDIMIRTAMAESTPTRRVIVSNERDFFEDFVRTYGARIPTYTGSFGNEWDLLTASLADASARMRRAVERLRTAEALATVVALRDPSVLDGLAAARDDAFLRMGMYYDHDWTADTPLGRTPRMNFQRDAVSRVEAYVFGLHDTALARLAASIPAAGAAGQRFVVFNGLGWQRDDVVELTTTVPPPLRVVDVTSGQELPSQPVAGGRVRVLARAVPGVGYTVVEVRAGAGASMRDAASVTGNTLDNGRYRVTVAADGALTSVLDHRAGDRDLVRAGAALNRMNGAAAGTVSLEGTGPVSTTLRVTAGGAPAHTTRVTLYAGVDRVEVENRVTQNFGNAVGYQYDFRASAWAMRHEEVGMIARVARNADGGDYADRYARTDHLSLGHFVDVSEAAWGVTLSNADSSFMRVASSTPDTLDLSRPSVFAVVGMQPDGPDLGFANQGGDRDFLNRYALVAHGAYDQAAAMRASMEHQNPLVARALAPAPGASAPARWGLLAVDSPDVLVWAVKPAEEGIARGVVVRAWNLADAPRTATFTTPGATLRAATATTHIETDTAPAAVSGARLTASFARQQMLTWRLTVDTPTSPPMDAGAPLDAAVDAAPDVARIDVAPDTAAPDVARPDVAPPPDAPPPPDAARPDAALDVARPMDVAPPDVAPPPDVPPPPDVARPMDVAPPDVPPSPDVPPPPDVARPMDVAPPDAPAVDAAPDATPGDVPRDAAAPVDRPQPDAALDAPAPRDVASAVDADVDASAPDDVGLVSVRDGCACRAGAPMASSRALPAWAGLCVVAARRRRRRARDVG